MALQLLPDNRRPTRKRGGVAPKPGLIVAISVSAIAVVAAFGVTRIAPDASWLQAVSYGLAALVIVVTFALTAPTEGKIAVALLLAAAPTYAAIKGVAGIPPEPKYADGRLTEQGETIVVQNKVTSGRTGMVEDDEPLRLFTKPRLCNNKSCVIAGYTFDTGDKLTGVVCQVPDGDRLTNGSDVDPGDDLNRHLHESRRWYGVKLSNGKLAFAHETWMAPSDRGGKDLPRCKA